MKLTQNNIEILSQGIADFFALQQYKDILKFAVEDIDLSDDVSADKSKIDLENYPYMLQPLSRCSIQSNIRKEVCIAFPEQMGKTMIQMIAILHAATYNTLQAIICYPSAQLAVETSTVKFIPLFKKMQQFKEEIEKPFAIRSDRLKLSNALIYWQGAGSKIVSKSAKLVLADEAAIFETPNNVNNLNQLKKRTRSYQECLQLFVSTPRYKEDNFWREWLSGSQAYFYLMCKGCGKLTMRSCDIHNLQFETIYNDELKQYVAVRGSERLICPECKHQHIEADREYLTKNGAYIHKYKERVETNPSFQAGVLASLLNVHSWGNIADIQLASGKGATLQDYISFDNSIRGLPYQERNYNKQDETALSKHYFKPDELNPDDIQAIIISEDTQMTFSVYCVMALTKQNNFYVLQIGRLRYLWLDDEQRAIINSENERNKKPPEVTLLDLLDKQFYGIKPLLMICDERGNRSAEMKNFATFRKNIILYGGTSLKYDKWKPSENLSKFFLVDAKTYQSQLIFMLYFHQNKQSNYLYLPDGLSEKDIEEITSFQPDTQKRNGNLYENWTPKDKVHDAFDAIKMALVGFQIASKIFRKERFRCGEARLLNLTRPKKVVSTQNQRKTVNRKPLFKR